MGIISKLIQANGVYRAVDDGADGYSVVTVDVPNSYSAADEGKVVENGGLIAQTALSVTQNGVYDTTDKNSVVVNVSGGGGGTAVALVTIYFDVGDTVTATDGTTTLVSDTSGEYLFQLPNAGTWTFSDGADTQIISVSYGFAYWTYLSWAAVSAQFSGMVYVREVWNEAHTYKALKWYFDNVSVTSTSGMAFAEPLLSLRPANNRPNNHAWNAKCYPNKGSYSGDLCIYYGGLRYISTPYHSSWLTGSNLYAILYTAHPDYASSFLETDFTTLAGWEGDTQQNEWEEP